MTEDQFKRIMLVLWLILAAAVCSAAQGELVMSFIGGFIVGAGF